MGQFKKFLLSEAAILGPRLSSSQYVFSMQIYVIFIRFYQLLFPTERIYLLNDAYLQNMQLKKTSEIVLKKRPK